MKLDRVEVHRALVARAVEVAFERGFVWGLILGAAFGGSICVAVYFWSTA